MRTTILSTFLAVVFGFLTGISLTKFLSYRSNLIKDIEDSSDLSSQTSFAHTWSSATCNISSILKSGDTSDTLKVYLLVTSLGCGIDFVYTKNISELLMPYPLSCSPSSTVLLLQRRVPKKPRGAERLPSGIVASESDFYLRRLWGKPSEDLPFKEKYLVAFTVGYNQKSNIDAVVKKFSNNFTIVLFHYDGRATEWDEFEWSKRAIHVSATKQTKWWYAKRFLHPDIVAPYEYIFIWDEDLGVEHFDAEEYIKLLRKHGLEISQPGLEHTKKFTWPMTRKMDDHEVHKETIEKPGGCNGPLLPPCAAFVEIMAPVFSRDAWRCVWHMIQNDLVHGWGIDFSLRRCVEPAHEKIGVVDAQWIVHRSIPSLGNQGISENGKKPTQVVRERCLKEWRMFQDRMIDAENKYYDKVCNSMTGSKGRR